MKKIKEIQPAIPLNVTIMLNTNAKVLIVRAPLKSLFRLLFRQSRLKIRGIIPPRPNPINMLMIDHGNHSRILLISSVLVTLSVGRISTDSGAAVL